MKIFALFCAAVIVLIACSQETSSHDVEWYLSHPKEHQEQLNKCKSDPGKLSGTADCINAEAAADKRATGYGVFKPK